MLAEVEIHCIKEAARFVAGKLENSVVPTDSIFHTDVNIFFPGKLSKALVCFKLTKISCEVLKCSAKGYCNSSKMDFSIN